MRHGALSACLASVVLGACGPDIGVTLELGLRAQQLPELSVFRVAFHPSERGCDALLAQPLVKGLYEAVGTRSNAEVELAELRRGNYSVVAHAGPTLLEVQASGCVEGVAIEDGERAQIAIRLE